MGTTFFVSPLSGVLTDLMGIRKTTFLGGAIASCGMFLSSFCVDSIVALCITYGMYGLGGSLAYTPSLAVLGHYFKNYLGIVNGIVTAGSSVFTICMPYVMDAFLKHFGIVWTLRLLALIAAMIMLAAFLFKPITMNSNYNNGKIVLNKSISFKSLFNMTVLKNRKYLIWTFVISISLFGYFVPYVYMLKFVEANFSKDDDNKLPVLCIGITSGLGRLIFGFIADMKNINRILLQQLAFLAIGLFTIILPFTSGHYGWLIVVVLGMGLFDGCFISLLGPLAFDICGRNGATQAIGYLLGLCSIPLTIGPYIAGLILDYNNNDYTIIFILAGIPPTLGSLALYLTRCVNSGVNKQEVGTEYKIQENTIVQEKFNSNNDDEKISLTGKSQNSNVVYDDNENISDKRRYIYTIL